jgi:hypothetical protein
MRARSTRFVALAFVVVLAGAAGAATAQPRTVQVIGGQGEIRANPNPRGTVLLEAPEGTVLEVLGREFDWYKVTIPPGLRPRTTSPATGYIQVQRVKPVADPAGGAAKPGGAQPAAQRAAQGGTAGTPLRVRLFGTVMYETFAAADSFEALYGSASAPLFGGGVDVSIGKWLFVQADVTFVQRTGERVFVFNGEAFPLGIRQEMSLTPIGITLGYRRAGVTRMTPYAGGGVLAAFYSEESELGDTDANVSETGWGWQGVAGVEFRLSRAFSAAVEGGYRSIPGILGEDGVSKEFGEKDLGGFTFGVKVMIGR